MYRNLMDIYKTQREHPIEIDDELEKDRRQIFRNIWKPTKQKQ